MRSRHTQSQIDIHPRRSKPVRQVKVENKMPILEQDTKMRLQPAVPAVRSANGAPLAKDTTCQRTLFEDPTNIQHWAASSARGSGLTSSNFHPSLDLTMDPMLPSAGSMFTGYDPDMTGSMNQAYPEFLYSPESPIFSNEDAFTQIPAGSKFSHPFVHSEAPLMEFTASAGGNTSSSGEFPGSDTSLSGSALSPQFWLDNSSEDGMTQCLDMAGITYGPWSPSMSSADMSLSSGCPGGSLVSSNFLGSPACMTGLEDLTTVPSNDEFLPFPLEHCALRKGSYDCVDTERSTADQDATYPSGPPVQLGYHGVAYTLPQTGVRAKAFYSNRLGSDGENIKARQHELYNVGPASDGLYHCPFVNDGECNRRPDKLKCNYDKHMDSHLKPYRCQDPACADVPFSSTACLLRHEREAHGLHGHGERPYSCYFDGCERATPGYGFPRRWNLQDHMRRVHNYVLPDTDCAEAGGARKKKNSATSASSRRGSRQATGRSRA